jgi:hypothetical protein
MVVATDLIPHIFQSAWRKMGVASDKSPAKIKEMSAIAAAIKPGRPGTHGSCRSVEGLHVSFVFMVSISFAFYGVDQFRFYGVDQFRFYGVDQFRFLWCRSVSLFMVSISFVFMVSISFWTLTSIS